MLTRGRERRGGGLEEEEEEEEKPPRSSMQAPQSKLFQSSGNFILVIKPGRILNGSAPILAYRPNPPSFPSTERYPSWAELGVKIVPPQIFHDFPRG